MVSAHSSDICPSAGQLKEHDKQLKTSAQCQMPQIQICQSLKMYVLFSTLCRRGFSLSETFFCGVLMSDQFKIQACHLCTVGHHQWCDHNCCQVVGLQWILMSLSTSILVVMIYKKYELYDLTFKVRLIDICQGFQQSVTGQQVLINHITLHLRQRSVST